MEDCHCTKRLDSWQENGQKDTQNLLCTVGPFSPPSGPGFQTPPPTSSLMAKTHPSSPRILASIPPSDPEVQSHFSSDPGMQYSFPLPIDPVSQAPVLLPSNQGT